METFLSCDWGTSSFRLRLIQTNTLKVMAEIKSSSGILDTFHAWQQTSSPSDRVSFYASIITNQIKFLQEKHHISLEGIPVVLSGMASSTIGLKELPYKDLPFCIDGSDLNIDVLNNESTNPLIIISGTKTADDIMRGEETKLVGSASFLDPEQAQLFILPGTHPKHVIIKNSQVISFQTFMTGEFFDLLTTKSILSDSIEASGSFEDPINRESFLHGVRASQKSNILHNSFMVRTNQILKQLSKEQNFYYLSGLLIGTELNGLTSQERSVYLLSGPLHTTLYTLACEVLGVKIIHALDADQALIRGQEQLFSRFSKQY